MRPATISEAARQAGVSVETIRFYERRGLIEQPPKPQGSGYRVYPPEQIKRVRFIRQAQEVGLALSDIAELLSLRADPEADCSAVRQQITAKLEEVEQRIEQLRQIRSALAALIAVCPGHGGLQACSILDTFSEGREIPGLRVERGSLAPGVLPTRRPRRRNDAGITNVHKERVMKFVTLKVGGMHCESCAETIKALLDRTAGVRKATASFKDGEAQVHYDPGAVSESQLVAAIERDGYRVTPANHA